MSLVFPRNIAPETTLRRSRSLSYVPLAMLEFYSHNFQFHVTGEMKCYFPLSVTPSSEMSNENKNLQTLSSQNFAYRPFSFVLVFTIGVVNGPACVSTQTKYLNAHSSVFESLNNGFLLQLHKMHTSQQCQCLKQNQDRSKRQATVKYNQF